MKIYTDAGARGNPGKAACAYIVVKSGKITEENVEFLGTKTNNEAEYGAIIFALENTKEKEFELISDSELVIRQINGEYKITKPHLRELYEKVCALIAGRKIKFSNAGRENDFISRADELVNEELDRH
jgi:ribonuclease HI